MGDASGRRLPNILITGTPGTGKTAHCEALMELAAGLTHVDVNEVAKRENLYAGFDDARQAHVLDDDKVVDALDELLKGGGKVVDTHSLVDYMPERFFDLVVVLTTDNTLLYDRLAKRGYPVAKISENVQAEIMKVIEGEALESYAQEAVQVLKSDGVADLESNVARIAAWAEAWVKGQPDAEAAPATTTPAPQAAPAPAPAPAPSLPEPMSTS